LAERGVLNSYVEGSNPFEGIEGESMAVKDTLFMESTTKDPEITMAEIKVILKKYGLTGFHESYSDGEISGCVFSVDIMGTEAMFSLPINWRPLWDRAKRGETKYIKDEIQAQRVAWRQVYRWIESQLALIDVGMAEFHEVFLPYLMVGKNETLFHKMKKNNFMIEDKR
jgi:hypothetical protein